MTRYDYRQSAFERLIGRRPELVLDRALLSALAALALALLAVVTLAATESRRIAALDTELGALADRIATAERVDARDERAIADLAHARRVQAAVLAAHADTGRAANAIARIGNRLPSQTWLTNLRDDPAGGWSIAGRSTRIDEIGATLAAIGRLDPAATARLVSIAASGRTGRVLDFTIAWEPAR
jgi:Tfp pilus assembly protein PilN